MAPRAGGWKRDLPSLCSIRLEPAERLRTAHSQLGRLRQM
jgi:hypothetical protein